MAVFEGAGVALVTPMKANGEVNYDKLEEILEEQIAKGTDAIVACGTTGEASTLTHEEHLDVIRYTCQVVKKRIPVVAGTGSNCTQTAIYLSREAEKAGADGVLVDSIRIPVILYNIPGRTGVNIQPKTIVTLCRTVENIVGVKEASGNFSHIASLMSMAEGCVDLYSGNDDQIVPVLSMGGKGVISVLSNVAPAQTHEICASYFAGNVKKSMELQLEAIPLITELFREVNPIPVKAAMNLMGKEVGGLRPPLSIMEPQNQVLLEKAMKDYGIL